MLDKQKLGLFAGNQPEGANLVALHPDLLFEIEEIAVEEACNIETVANDLIALGLSLHRSSKGALFSWERLTPRECEIAVLIWLGMSNIKIAERLKISKYTVRAHNRNILSKFQVHSKKELCLVLDKLDLSEWVAALKNSPSLIN